MIDILLNILAIGLAVYVWGGTIGLMLGSHLVRIVLNTLFGGKPVGAP